MLLNRGNKTLARKTMNVKPKGGKSSLGQFGFGKRLVKPGRYSVQAIHKKSAALGGSKDRTGTFKMRYPDLDPGSSGDVVKTFNRLLASLGYVNDEGSKYDSATGRAVLAFHKVNNDERSENATASDFKKLAKGNGGYDLKWPEGGKHVEADLSRQVMVLAKGDEVDEIYHISSGAPATPTILGKFNFYRKDAGYNSIGMYYSAYFIRGYATHGYQSVPTYPASHGCLRNPIPPAPSFAAGALPAIEVPRAARSMISGNGEDADQHRDQVEPFPQVDQAEVEAQDARLPLLSDGGEQQAEQPHGEALQLRAGALPAERGDAGNAHHRHHEELGRAEGQHQRAHDRDRDRERGCANERADQRAHQRRAERAPRFAILGHRVAVDHRGGRQSLARNAEQDRGDVAGGRRDRMHPEQERERLHRAHLEHERQHQREGRRAADARKQADDEAQRHPDQHQAERVPLQHEREALEERVDHR